MSGVALRRTQKDAVIVESSFLPAWWLPGPHLQTMYPVLVRPRPALEVTLERVELPDGDFVDLAWSRPEPADPEAPLVVVFPGLGGSIRSTYARGLLRVVAERGWRGVLLHFRGTSGIPNRLARSYHAGETGDPRYLLGRIRERYPAAPMGAVGYSLGGSVLLALLAEEGEASCFSCAAVASVPLELGPCADRLQRGFSRVYDQYLLRDLLGLLRRRREVVAAELERLGIDLPRPLSGYKRARRLWSVRDFDDALTAPLHGFSGADDYYTRCSARPRLRQIARPTLVVQSRDDPFLDERILPEPSELSDLVTLEVSSTGGHVGFVEGESPAQPRFWLETRLPSFLEGHIAR